MGTKPSLRTVEGVVGRLEPHLPEAIRRIDDLGGWQSETVESGLVLALPVCGIATELATRALQMMNVPAERWQRPLPDALDLWSGHDIVRVGNVIVDPTVLSFTQLISLRPYEAQTNRVLRDQYPQKGMIAIFNESEALEQGSRFADFLYRTELKVRRELGVRGLRHVEYGVDRDINGRLFGVRDLREYRRAVHALWNVEVYTPVVTRANQQLNEAAELLVFRAQQGMKHAA